MLWLYSVLYRVIWYIFSRVFVAGEERDEGHTASQLPLTGSNTYITSNYSLLTRTSQWPQTNYKGGWEIYIVRETMYIWQQ